jgi:uncharacterized protein DUF4129
MNSKAKSATKNVVRGAMMVVLLMMASRADAASFEDYRARVSQAVNAMRQLEAPDYYAENQTQSLNFVETTLAHVRTLLPAKETVSFNAQTIEVDNSWLHEAIAGYEKNGHAQGTEFFRGIGERLRALAQRLGEIQAGSTASDKDANKARLAEILRRPEYNTAAVQGSAIERLLDRLLRWLASLFPNAKPLQPGTGRALSGVAQIIVIALSVALIAFLIWKFLPRYLRGRGKKKEKREARIVLGERLEPDQSAADLLEQAEGMARAGDLRGAIRKAYIALLCELGDRKVISLAQHKTNRDYLMSVRHKTSLYQSMRKLTYSFELHWYGFVPPAPDDWAEFRLGIRTASGSERIKGST